MRLKWPLRAADNSHQMKLLDYFLLSFVLALTGINVWLLTSDYPKNFVVLQEEDKLERNVPINTEFRHIILHHLDRPHTNPTFPFHIVIGDGSVYEDGKIIPTERWINQTGSRTIDIALAGRFTEKQQEALLVLLDRLCFEYRIPSEEVGSHFDLDGFTECAHNIDTEGLRRILAPQS